MSSHAARRRVARRPPRAKVRRRRAGLLAAAVGVGAVWAAGGPQACRTNSFVWRIDPSANRIAGRTAVSCAFGVVTGEGSVWVAPDQPGLLARVQP